MNMHIYFPYCLYVVRLTCLKEFKGLNKHFVEKCWAWKSTLIINIDNQTELNIEHCVLHTSSNTHWNPTISTCIYILTSYHIGHIVTITRNNYILTVVIYYNNNSLLPSIVRDNKGTHFTFSVHRSILNSYWQCT